MVAMHTVVLQVVYVVIFIVQDGIWEDIPCKWYLQLDPLCQHVPDL